MNCPWCNADDWQIINWISSNDGKQYMRCTKCTLEVNGEEGDDLTADFIKQAEVHTGPAKE